jgi:hypothetical protein
MLEFLCSTEGLDRQTAAWQTPLVTAVRWQMAYSERQGQPQDWGGSELDQVLAKLGTADGTS